MRKFIVLFLRIGQLALTLATLFGFGGKFFLSTAAVYPFQRDEWFLQSGGDMAAIGGILFFNLLLLFLAQTVNTSAYEKILGQIWPSRPRDSPNSTTTALTALSKKKWYQHQFSINILLVSAAFATLIKASALAAIVPISAAAILLSADAALRYRFKHALYGTNEYEARQLISFIVDNADEIDLSGGLGVSEINTDKTAQDILVATWGAVAS
jgi:hypothetical protein